MKTFLRWLCRLFFHVKISGKFPQNPSQKLLIIANHQSFLDGLLLGLFLPINPVFVVHTGVARSFWFRQGLRLVDYLAVDPTSPMAMKQVIKLLNQGRPVMIFPEGRITQTGSLMKIYDGPAFVAAKTEAQIIPVRIEGATRSYFSRMGGNYPKKLFPHITIDIQAPTQIPPLAGETARLRRRQAGEAMRHIMQNMLFSAHPEETLYGAFINAVDTFGRKRLSTEDTKQIEYRYQDLLKMVLALGRLSSKISRPQERIGVLLPNMASSVSLIIGMTAMRRVPAMLNYTAGTEGIQNACAIGQISTILTSKEFVIKGKFGDMLAGLQGIKIIYLENLRPQFTLWDKVWLMAFALRFPRLAVPKGDSSQAAVVLFTSGSEGLPKGVVHTHQSLLANIGQIKSVIDFTTEDKFLNPLPIFHAFGLTAGALLPLFTGSKLFLYPSPLHYKVIPEIVYDRRCTVLFGTSTFLANYAKHAHPYDFNSLRYVVAGAEKLSPAVRDTWHEKFGLRIYEGYGATETAPVLSVNTPMAYLSGTVGQFLPGIEHRLMPVEGISDAGQLHVRGPNIMAGYLLHSNIGEITPAQSELGKGWYNTGDIVKIDSEGFIHIKGRVKRFAKIAGEMVSLETVEKIAIAASNTGQHAASTQPDAQRGESIVLFTTDNMLNREQLSQAAKNIGAPELAIPRKIVIVDALPLLGTGKLDYVSLKKMAQDV